MPPACSSAARSATASPPWAALSRPIGPTRFETTISRRGADFATALKLPAAGAWVSVSPIIDPAVATSSPGISPPRSPPVVETALRRPCSASSRRCASCSRQPFDRGSHRKQRKHRRRTAGLAADPDRHTAPAIDLGETVFVSRIVAEIDRPAPLKRQLGHKGGDDPTLVVMPGLELDDHLAGDQAQAVAMLFQQPGGGIADRCFRLRHGAVMQGERAALVLDKDARPMPRNRGHFRPQPPKYCRRGATPN